jgi:dTDP-4-dehydrorhamnose 3,5-epimerase
MDVEPLAISDVMLIRTKHFEDARGFFTEIYNRKTFAAAGLDLDFVQDNLSCSVQSGTIRGLHYQSAPFAQDKLVRVIKGRIFDVAVDIRRNSSTFGKSVSVELAADNRTQLLVPIGFAHGFCTLEPDTVVSYKVTDFYSASHDRGIRWSDPELAIEWPLESRDPHLSDKDLRQPMLKEIAELF